MKNIDYFEFAKSLNKVYQAGMQEGIEQEAQSQAKRQRVSEVQARYFEKSLDCHTLKQIGQKLIAWSEDYDELFTCEELQQVIDQLGAVLDVSK